MRSLYSGVSGIRSHQTRMDVIGNNIANVNTVGFKSSRVTFTDVFSQTMSSGSNLTNPQQIGLGVQVGSTDLITDDGAFQMTGRSLDLAISGAGMFVLKGGDNAISYGRAGAFDWNAEGYLFSPSTGLKVQGWMADANGQIGRTDRATMTDIKMIRGDVSLPVASTEASFKGNLDAAASPGDSSADPAIPADTHTTAITAYDSLGRPISITFEFTKTTTGWTVNHVDPYTGVAGTANPLTFDKTGKMTGTTNYQITIEDPDDQANDLVIDVDFSAVTQAFDGASATGESTSTAEINNVNGRAMGTLQNVFVNELGVITGSYSNGDSKVIAQIAMANFNNMAGLMKQGTSTFIESPASGVPQVGTPGSSGRGSLVPGNLEGSNVDLASEFTNMILTQRGYQASAKMVSTADDMLAEVINLKR